jgi:activator of 2-hydroxyglutaryl-CoA dehydratase
MGRPIEVLREGMRQTWERFGERLGILGVGSTGSGRHLAAKMLGADAVRNEITAQMVSSAWFVPEVDTIFEIGGQAVFHPQFSGAGPNLCGGSAIRRFRGEGPAPSG